MIEPETAFVYKGFRGTAEYEPWSYYGRILDISDLVTYEGEVEGHLEPAFQEAVENYLSTCEQVGKFPDYPEPQVFLGGTCNGSSWRERIIPQLEVPYYNPVVEDWTPECQAEEERIKKLCPVHLYVITPLMRGVYSVAEAVDDSSKMPVGTIFVALREDDGEEFDDGEWKSIEAVAKLVDYNGGLVYYSLGETVDFLNNMTPYFLGPLYTEYHEQTENKKEIKNERQS